MSIFHVRANLKFTARLLTKCPDLWTRAFQLGRMNKLTKMAVLAFMNSAASAFRSTIEETPECLPALVDHYRLQTALCRLLGKTESAERFKAYCEMVKIDGMEGALAAFDDAVARAKDEAFGPTLSTWHLHFPEIQHSIEN